MQLFIQVYAEERHEFNDLDEPGRIGYLRPAAAFRENPDSTESVSSVRISLITDMTENDSKVQPIEIDSALESAIAAFVNMHLGKKTGLDCYGFVNLVGKKVPHHVRESSEHWEIKRIDCSEITPGSIVAFCNSDSLFRHAAVCVTGELFISVFGINGDLEFATFEDLQAPYNTKEVYLLTPL